MNKSLNRSQIRVDDCSPGGGSKITKVKRKGMEQEKQARARNSLSENNHTFSS